MAESVIDMWAPIVPSHEIMAHVAHNFPEPQLGYLRVFQNREPNLEDWSKAARAMTCDDGAILESFDEAGIEKAVPPCRVGP